jgi:hypothetical protein
MRDRSKPIVLLVAVAVVCLLGVATVATAQETTGALQGTVTMKSDKSALPGVAVEAIHVPTGTHYTAVTGANGRFNILNVRVGGPYSVTTKLSGFKTQTMKNVDVALGEKRNLEFALDLESVQQSVEVTAESMPLISPDRMGSATAVSEAEIKVLPTIRRQFQDFAKTNPYVNVSASDPTQTSISVGGKNNRYNTIQIDGAVNNDLFGLAATGTPGGQTDTQPISLDTIQELQVVVSPYDVKQGGFTGGAINAITRSGSNTFTGSIYGPRGTRAGSAARCRRPTATRSTSRTPPSTRTRSAAGSADRSSRTSSSSSSPRSGTRSRRRPAPPPTARRATPTRTRPEQPNSRES